MGLVGVANARLRLRLDRPSGVAFELGFGKRPDKCGVGWRARQGCEGRNASLIKASGPEYVHAPLGRLLAEILQTICSTSAVYRESHPAIRRRNGHLPEERKVAGAVGGR